MGQDEGKAEDGLDKWMARIIFDFFFNSYELGSRLRIRV